jgi:hypothetical protein
MSYSTIGTVNNTITDVEYEERLLQEGVRNITDYVDALKSGTQKIPDTFSAKDEIEGHNLRVSNAMETV